MSIEPWILKTALVITALTIAAALILTLAHLTERVNRLTRTILQMRDDLKFSPGEEDLAQRRRIDHETIHPFPNPHHQPGD